MYKLTEICMNASRQHMGHLEEKAVVFLHKGGNSYYGKVDCIDYEDESIHLENDEWYWMQNITKIMVIK